MCGIGGWVAFGESRPDLGTPSRMLSALEERGYAASGIAWLKEFGSDFKCCKHHISGSQLLSIPHFRSQEQSISQSQVCIMHTRAPTKGDAANNHNNHPVFRKDGKYVAVHNGIISNDDSIFETLKVKRQAEVDSEAIVACLDAAKDETPQIARKALEELSGSYAILAFPQKKADHLIIVRNSSPIVFVFDVERRIFFFASTVSALSTAFIGLFSEEARKLTIHQSTMRWPTEMKDDTYIILTKDGIIATGKHTSKRVIYHYGADEQGWWEGEGITGEGNTPGRRQAYRPFDRAGAGEQRSLGAGVNSVDLDKGLRIYPAALPLAPAVGIWSANHLTLFGPEGFRTPTTPGLNEMMCSFSDRCFPEFIGENLKANAFVTCPACWGFVSARTIHDMKMHCPICKTELIANFKRQLTLEEKAGHVSRPN